MLLIYNWSRAQTCIQCSYFIIVVNEFNQKCYIMRKDLKHLTLNIDYSRLHYVLKIKGADWSFF